MIKSSDILHLSFDKGSSMESHFVLASVHEQ